MSAARHASIPTSIHTFVKRQGLHYVKRKGFQYSYQYALPTDLLVLDCFSLLKRSCPWVHDIMQGLSQFEVLPLANELPKGSQWVQLSV